MVILKLGDALGVWANTISPRHWCSLFTAGRYHVVEHWKSIRKPRGILGFFVFGTHGGADVDLVENYDYVGKTIDGAFAFRRPLHPDARGSFSTLYRSDWHGWDKGLQFNVSFSKKGVFRGMHFSGPEIDESKYVSCVQGSILDVIWDVRPESPTFGRICSVYLTDCDGIGVRIPPGCAHGFVAFKDSIVGYASTRLWKAEDDRGYSIFSSIPANFIREKLDLLRFDVHFQDLILSDKDRWLPNFEI